MGSGLSAPGGTSGGFYYLSLRAPPKDESGFPVEKFIVFVEVLSLVTSGYEPKLNLLLSLDSHLVSKWSASLLSALCSPVAPCCLTKEVSGASDRRALT